MQPVQLKSIRQELERRAQIEGFIALGISVPDLEDDARRLIQWWKAGRGASMDYLVKHGSKRWNVHELVPGTKSVLSFLYPSWPDQAESMEILSNPDRAYIARYALGRDYHRIVRQRLQRLATWLTSSVPESSNRPFVDSAPVLEKRIAQQSGLGWIGKNTLLIHPKAGSVFFIGEIYSSIAFTPSQAFERDHCGDCRACLDVCPTRAFVAPQQLDARLCISYWSIESKDSIPENLRPAFGNRIFGCDDCQLVCPWNKFAQLAHHMEQQARHQLHKIELATLAFWTEQEYLQKTEGSALRRMGFESFQRNIAVALGNARPTSCNIKAIQHLLHHGTPLVQEHARWALRCHQPSA